MKAYKSYRIAIVAACPFPTSQGSQVLIRQLSEALVRKGHHVSVVTYHFGEDAPSLSLNLYRIPAILPYRKLRSGPSWRKPLLDVLLALRLFQVVKKHNIDIIHAHNYESALAGFLVRFVTGTPVLFHTHGVMEDELQTYFTNRLTRSLARNGARLIDRFVSMCSDHIIAITPEVHSFFLSKGIDKTRMDCIPPGICYPERSGTGRTPGRVACGPAAGPVVLYTGNLDAYQNTDFLFRSFCRALSDIPEARLVMLTHSDPGPAKKACRALNIEKQVVFITPSGFPQLQSFLEEAAVTVLPRTSWSGFPIKLLNYMAAGKAIVACKGAAKGIEHLHDGFVVPDNDIAAFADAIVMLANDRRLSKRLGENARQKAFCRNSWERIVREIETVYTKVLERKHGTGI